MKTTTTWTLRAFMNTAAYNNGAPFLVLSKEDFKELQDFENDLKAGIRGRFPELLTEMTYVTVQEEESWFKEKFKKVPVILGRELFYLYIRVLSNINQEIMDNTRLWLFKAYRNEWDFKNGKTFFQIRFSDHTELKTFSAYFSGGFQRTMPEMISDYKEVRATDRDYNEIEEGNLVQTCIGTNDYVGVVKSITSDGLIKVVDRQGVVRNYEYYEVELYQ